MKGEPYPRILLQQSNRKLEELLEIRRQELENANREALYYARYDYLTDLMNRPFLESEVQALMQKKPYGAMMMMDVDDFKQVNDRNGHPFGDQVLSLLAESLKASLPAASAAGSAGTNFWFTPEGMSRRWRNFWKWRGRFAGTGTAGRNVWAWTAASASVWELPCIHNTEITMRACGRMPTRPSIFPSAAENPPSPSRMAAACGRTCEISVKW